MTTSRRRCGRRDQAARARLAPVVEAGQARCWRCGQPIQPGEPWDAGHLTDLALGGDPSGEVRPEHARCNRAAGAALGLALRRGVAGRLRPEIF